MDESLVQLVWGRAGGRCEYCLMPQALVQPTHEVDHIIAVSHDGLTVLNNLALACFPCNHHKGPNIAGIDRKTRKVIGLFNPRRHSWPRHFRWEGARLVGRTPVGRVTIAVLKIDLAHRLALRQLLMD